MALTFFKSPEEFAEKRKSLFVSVLGKAKAIGSKVADIFDRDKQKPMHITPKKKIEAPILKKKEKPSLFTKIVSSKPETFKNPAFVAPQPKIKLKQEPKGNIAQRHNNPGNLIFVGQTGATKGEPKGDGQFWAQFKTVAKGRKAAQNDIQIKLDRTPNMTVADLILERSPVSDENDFNVIAFNVMDELNDLFLKGKTSSQRASVLKAKDVPLDRLEQALSKAEGFEVKIE